MKSFCVEKKTTLFVVTAVVCMVLLCWGLPLGYAEQARSGVWAGVESVPIDQTTFPDANFRTWCLSLEWGKDGILTRQEALGVKSIRVTGSGIAELKGIEYFAHLTRLDCSNNQLEKLDVSQNTALTELYCSNTLLQKLDVSQNISLKILRCEHNQLEKLDVGQNTALEYLDCSSNPLEKLDVSQNTALKYLACAFYKLEKLDVSQNTALEVLYCIRNQLEKLDVSQNTALKSLHCGFNKLEKLDVSQNKALEILYCFSNQLKKLDISQNKALKSLDCGHNQLEKLDVSQNTALKYLDCIGNQMGQLDLTNASLTNLKVSPQTVSAQPQEQQGQFYVNLSPIVGKENLSKVTVKQPNAYNAVSGLMTVPRNANTASYFYQTGQTLMEVRLDLTFTPNKRSGIFYYGNVSEKADKDFSSTYYYDDAYFEESGYSFKQPLATMSMCLALSAYASNEGGYENQSKNVVGLLRDIGFESIKVNQAYREKPKTDSIGVCVGNKKITVANETYTLVSVAIRGGGYESEWASNFTVGESGLHQGFQEARNQAYTFLHQYINDPANAISGKVKVWITGYSRAAATANLLAAFLDDFGLGLGVSFTRNDLYAYCFEPPMGALQTDMSYPNYYGNIFNIVNPDDPVPKVAPARMGFCRYGIDKILPAQVLMTQYAHLFGRAIAEYLKFPSIDAYHVDKFVERYIEVDCDYTLFPPMINSIKIYFQNTKTPQNIYLDNLMILLSDRVFISRTLYVKLFQEGARTIMHALNFSEDQKAAYPILFCREITKKMIPITGALMLNQKEKLAKIIVSCAVEASNKLGTHMDEQQVKNFGMAVADLLVNMLIAPNDVLTVFWNLTETKSLLSAHDAELCLAWMQSFDSNYVSNAIPAYAIDSYRVVRVNCPVNVFVKNKAGETVASIMTAGEVQNPASGGVFALVDSSDQRVFYVSADADYEMEVIAVAGGEVSYSVSEFCQRTGSTSRLLNYNRILVASGDQLVGKLPAYSQSDIDNGNAVGSSSQYSLALQGTSLSPTVEMRGEQAANAYYYVEALSASPQQGNVSGSGLRLHGEFAKLVAKPYAGYQFAGWYENGICISVQNEYRFEVVKDRTLIAKFNAQLFQIDVEEKDKDTLHPSARLAAAGDLIIVTSPNGVLLVNGTPIEGKEFFMPAFNVMLSLVEMPQTGDQTNILLYLICMLASGCVIIAYVKKRRI